MDSLRDGAASGQPIEVLIVDDHPIFRRGIRDLLETDDDILLLAEVGSIAEALQWLSGARADVVLLDHNLPGTRGITGLPKLLEVQHDLQAIILTICDDNNELLRAIRYGACGYILKDAPPERLLEAIHAAVSSDCRVSGRIVNSLLRHVDSPASTPVLSRSAVERPGSRQTAVTGISPREQAILASLCRGLSNKEIAREVGLSPNTVRNQLQRLQERFHARNRVQLALLARDEGLVPGGFSTQ